MTASTRSPMVTDVGARIRSLRTAKGLTQAQLADPLYTKAYISMLESGRTRASMKALEHIAGALGVTPADLLGGQQLSATPQYQLLEGRRLYEGGRAADAVAILEGLTDGLQPADQLVRLRYLANAYSALGRAKDAFPVLERAQRIAATLADREEAVRIKAVLASAYRRTYAYDESARLLKEVIDACESGVLKDPVFHFRRVIDLGSTYLAQREPRLALAQFERGIELSADFGDRRALANVYAGMADSYQADGDIDGAIRYSQRSLQLYEELGMLEQIAGTLDNAAMLYAQYGNRERARECLARGARIAEDIDSQGTLASIRVSEAEVAAKTGHEDALEITNTSLKFARKVDQVDASIRALCLLGELRAGQNVAASRRSFNEAVQLAEQRAPHMLRTIFERWSHAAETSGDGDEALRLARRALELVRV